MKGVLTRLTDDGKQTLGVLTVFQGIDKIFECKTLELPFKDNQRRVSCIPTGTYQVEKRKSPSQGWSYHIKDVKDRDWILIHKGNYYTDILGCVLVGSDHTDINGDGLRDVVRSGDTLGKLLELVEKFELTIIDLNCEVV